MCRALHARRRSAAFLHLYDGEEAVAVGVIPVLEQRDRIVATYREHGHALVRGVPMGPRWPKCTASARAAAAGGAARCICSTPGTNFYGGNAIVGGGLPLAVGLALADQMRGEDNVTACFFGEGAVAEGEFHESLNLAALWSLPVLFVCENNLYAMGTALAISESETDIQRKAACYRMAAEASMAWTWSPSRRRRGGRGGRSGRRRPYFLECRTYRLRAHSMFDAQLYRDKAEVEAWRAKEPILRFRTWLDQAGMLHQRMSRASRPRSPRKSRRPSPSPRQERWEPVEELTRYVSAEKAA